MLAFLPLIGPLLSGVASIASSWNATKIAKDKNDLEEVKTRIASQRKDIRFQIQQDMVVFPVCIWMLLGTWDTIIAHRFPELRFIVEKFPAGPLEYLPFAVLAYLFGLAIRNKF